MPTLKSVRLEHRGGMAFHAEPSSGHPLDFDDRTSNTGGSPVETVLSALGSCTGMDVVSILTKKRQDVTGYRVEVSGTQRDEYPQVYTRGRRHARGRRPRSVGGGDPPRDRAVGAEVLPGQRDGVRGCHDRPSPLQDPFRGGGQLRHRGRGDLHRPVPQAGRRRVAISARRGSCRRRNLRRHPYRSRSRHGDSY